VLVDDHDLAVHHDVVGVALEQGERLDRVVQERDERSVGRLVEVVDAEVVLDLLDAGLEHADRALLLVDLEVDPGLEGAGDLRELGEPAVRLARGRAGDDERGAGLVDEDRVDLVDDAVEVAALDEVLAAPRHVVAQVVEAELVVRAVGDVGLVLLAADLGVLTRDHGARRHAEGAEDATHELGLVRREEVVDRDDVDALAGDRIQVRRERRGQGLALTGLHLGDVAEVEGGAAHDLDVVGTLTEGAARGLAHSGEGLGHELVERLARLVARAQLGRLAAQLLVGEVRVVLFERRYGLHDLLQPAQDAAFTGTKQFLEGVRHGGSPSVDSAFRRAMSGCRCAGRADIHRHVIRP